MHEKRINGRALTLVLLFVFPMLAFSATLVKIQLIDGAVYAAAGNSVYSKNVNMKAARGEILDRNGNPLVTNRQGSSIVFESAYFPASNKQEKRNEIILSLIKLFEAANVTWIDNLPVLLDIGNAPYFAENRKSDITKLKSKNMLNLNDYATAENCLDALIDKYSLQDYSIPDARKIASVCYEMKRLDFSISYPYTFAEDVPTELVAKIKENGSFYQGVNVEIVPYREYVDGTLAPHVLGTVGAINSEEYSTLKSSGYRITDNIGKSGIESAMETYLRGTDGKKTIETASSGSVSTTISEEPRQGDSVVLTLDKKLQQVTQQALEDVLHNLNYTTFPAGAAIVMDVNSFEVLACATYPTYDSSTYKKNYSALATDEKSPLWNRALLSTYEPGSAIKPSVAIAALEEGIITENTTFYCTGAYKYLDSSFKCAQFHSTRNQNVRLAIKESCNSFFYECGKQLGYLKMNEYRRLLGLGQKTGLEINEAIGIMDSPDYRASVGSTWHPGYNIQTAIGQGNLFSQIQLAVYTSTIANGGTRYNAHLVKSIRTYGTYETILSKEPEVACETGFSKKTMDIVKEAMLQVGLSGTIGRNFSNLPVQVAAKTGTSQVYRNFNGVTQKVNNVFMISFAPYDNPQIAVVLVAEGSSSSTALSPMAARIYDYYFSNVGEFSSLQAENTLLS
ncbi:MAG TPA: penicillin-binding transpeptidase domain-containing protein [Clostridia bacterium]|nr:penicillin-binding transpeptidase domain-containing protein [Clostridia bacterium]